ncbi:hypothetical protein ACJRO7_032058 [Eucalyptus globulus]|uniref:Uncharacterized protein n=1 Tax=Eucalyptus globulus TaxID=34317 RepID=A0ABD3JUW0_EUCGL
MDGDQIWEQRRARLNAPKSVFKRTQLQPESKYRVHLLLCAAVKEGDVDEFMEALEKNSVEERVTLSDIIYIRGPSGNSLLHVAAGIWKPDILQALIEVRPGKKLAANANYRGDTVLHIAARAGRIRTAELLLGCGGVVDKANDMGNTMLHEAVKSRHYELTHLLLSRGSRSVYQENKEGNCPL